MKTPLYVMVGAALVGAVLALAAGRLEAKTPDGSPPSVETVCDNEQGAAFGLCNAYCEAMDCDSPNHRASDNACASVRRNFERKTGRPMPCQVTCPCGALVGLFGAIERAEATVTACFITESSIFVLTSTQEFTRVDLGPPPFCSANERPPVVELTTTEQLVCRVGLRAAAEAQGVECVHPE